MNLVFLAALIAACQAAKLDRTYLPPPSSQFAGGPPGFLQAPFITGGNRNRPGFFLTPFVRTSDNNPSQGKLPSGSYENENEGVVVEAAAPGTRASNQPSGLGGPRVNYGSTDSKVGDAAFRGTKNQPGPNTNGGFQTQTQFGSSQSQGSFGLNNKNQDNSDLSAFYQPTGQVNAGFRPGNQVSRDRLSNIIKYHNKVGLKKFNYGFETENGIKMEQNGVSNDGIHTQGGYSYTGNDGKVYSVVYTADKDGYRPMGAHLPTSPPIPEEILEALEQNARDEANGLYDDGSYDAQKYNAEDDYTQSDTNGNNNDRQSNKFEKRPGFNAGASINQQQQGFVRPNVQGQFAYDFSNTDNTKLGTGGIGIGKPQNVFNAQLNNKFGSQFQYLPPFEHSQESKPLQDIGVTSSQENQNNRPQNQNLSFQTNLQSSDKNKIEENLKPDLSRFTSQLPTLTPIAQSVAPAKEYETEKNTFNVNGITQASISPFPSITSTSSSHTQSGEVYEYPKPDQGLPAASQEDNQGSSLQTTAQDYNTKPQINGQPNTQFGQNFPTTSTSLFGQSPNQPQIAVQGSSPFGQSPTPVDSLSFDRKTTPSSSEAQTSTLANQDSSFGQQQTQTSFGFGQQTTPTHFDSFKKACGVCSTFGRKTRPQSGTQNSFSNSQTTQFGQIPTLSPIGTSLNQQTTSTRFGAQATSFGQKPTQPESGVQTSNPIGTFGSLTTPTRFGVQTGLSDQKITPSTFETNSFTKQQTTPTFGVQADSTLGQQTTPTFGVETSSGFGQKPTQTFGEHAGSTLGQQTTPTFGEQITSTFGQKPTQTFGVETGFTLGQQTIPTLGVDTSPTFGQKPTQIFGMQTGSTLGQQTTPTFGEPTSSTFGQKPSQTFGVQTGSTLGQQTTPTFGVETSSTFGQKPTQTFGVHTGSTLGQQTTPTFGEQTSSTFGQNPTQTFGVEPGFTLGQQTTPTFGMETSSTFGHEPTQTFGVQTGSSLGKQTTPTFGEQTSSTFGQKPTQTFGVQTGLTLGQQTTPTFGEPTSSTFGKKPSQTFGVQTGSTLEQQTTPTFGEQTMSTFGQKPTQTFGVQTGSTLGQQTTPTFGEQTSSTFGQNPTQTFGVHTGSTLGQQTTPTFSEQTTSTFGQKPTQTFGVQTGSTSGQQTTPTFGIQTSSTFEQATSTQFDGESSEDSQSSKESIETTNSNEIYQYNKPSTAFPVNTISTSDSEQSQGTQYGQQPVTQSDAQSFSTPPRKEYASRPNLQSQEEIFPPFPEQQKTTNSPFTVTQFGSTNSIDQGFDNKETTQFSSISQYESTRYQPSTDSALSAEIQQTQSQQSGEVYHYNKPLADSTIENNIFGQKITQAQFTVQPNQNKFDITKPIVAHLSQNTEKLDNGLLTTQGPPDYTQTGSTPSLKPVDSRPQFSFYSACCQGNKTQNTKDVESSSDKIQSNTLNVTANFEGISNESGLNDKFGYPGSDTTGSSGLGVQKNTPNKGEDFGGPRKPPTFDETGYHY